MYNQYNHISELNLTMSSRDEQTIIEDVYFTAPLKITKPFFKNNWLLIMLISVSAGLMSGDAQLLNLHIKKDSQAELTSQSYEKIHYMNEGFACRKTNIQIDENACFLYHPLPILPFRNSNFKNEVTVHLKDETSRFVYSEILACGRAARNEIFAYTRYQSLSKIFMQDKLIYLDNSIYIPSQINMTGFLMYEKYTHLLNFVYIGNVDEGIFPFVYDIFNNSTDINGGISKIENGICIKILSTNSENLLKVEKTLLSYIKNMA